MGCGGPKPAGKSRRFCDSCKPPAKTKGVCKGCGDRPITVARGRYCDECRVLHREASEARIRAADQAKRQPCKGCGKVKPPGRFKYCPACARKRSGPRLCERCPNPARTATAKLCEACRAQSDAAERAYQRQWNIDHPRRRSGPVKADVQRMHARLQAEREGKTLKLAPPIMVKTSGDGHQRRADSASFPGLPAPQFAALIERLIVKERAKLYELALMSYGGEDGSQAVVCESLGVVPRRLSAWRRRVRDDAAAIGPRLESGRFSRHWGDGDSVSFDVADRALSAAGLLWFDVWRGDELCTNGKTVEWVFTTTELLADAA